MVSRGSFTKICPGLKRACLAIAYDNGMVNRSEGEDLWLRRTDEMLLEAPILLTLEAETWLNELDDEQMLVLCAGEATEAAALMRGSPNPRYVDHLLNCVFDESWGPYTA